MRFLPLLLLLVFPLAAREPAVDYRASLTQWEGLRLKPYRDPILRDWIVGVGHSLTAHHQAVKPLYTRDEVSDLFDHDLADALHAARRLVVGFDEMPDGARLVTIHLIWSCGAVGFERFVNLRRALSKGAFNAASVELATSKWARQVSPFRRDFCVYTLNRL